MNRFASTRSEVLVSQPWAGRAQCSVGSIDDEGIRYGLTTQALIASTISTAPAIVTTQSRTIRHRRGSRCVRRVTGFRGTSSAGAASTGSPATVSGSSPGAGGESSGGGTTAVEASYEARFFVSDSSL